MGLYNFQPRFVPFILDGSKTHTIRATRTYPDKPGNTLHLYTGLRTTKARLLLRAECVKVEHISICSGGDGTVSVVIGNAEMGSPALTEYHDLSVTEKDLLAWRDGFRLPVRGPGKHGLRGCFDLMIAFWIEKHGPTLDFGGQIIHWKFPAIPAGASAKHQPPSGSTNPARERYQKSNEQVKP